MYPMLASTATVFTFGTFAAVIGGLGIFLLGMKQISEGLQAVAGPRMRKLVAAATTNRFAGVLTGAVVTGIIQASAVTTVMVVGMVTSGIMTLMQAINVIIGANIGTTVTAWLVAIFPKLDATFGLGLAGFSALIYLFAKRESWKYWGLIFLGLGLIFYGLDLVKSNMSPLSQTESFIEALKSFAVTDPVTNTFSIWGMLKCIVVGAVATALIQSSSATTAIAVVLVTQRMISFDTAATLVLGMNIGTTVTTWFAAIGAPTDARRAALAHTLFNLIGVVIMAPFFPMVLPLADKMFGISQMDTTALGFAVAGIHTAFNIVNTVIFLPFTSQFAWLITRIIPASKIHELPRLTVLNPLKLAPVVAVEQARKEVELMSTRCESLLDSVRAALNGEISEETENMIFHSEEELDILQHEVSQFLGVIMTTNLPSDVANRARMLLRVADELESISDDVAALLKQFIRMRKANMKLSERGQTDIESLHDMCRTFAGTVCEAFRQGKMHAADLLNHMHSDAAGITARVKEIRKAEMTRMADHDPTINPLCAVVVLDILNIYRRLKEDCLNIGEAMLEEGRM
ncbi:MAG: Na/Pi cotransporter family protein [Kiritimatiellae bacterium]|nr:Na/Pi cotransporter family protein [Kiritimatiellia bacterium]